MIELGCPQVPLMRFAAASPKDFFEKIHLLAIASAFAQAFDPLQLLLASTVV